MSADADAFRSLLGDNDTRVFFAGLSDVVFAAGYGLLGVIAFRALAAGLVSTIGTVSIVGSALFDEIENVLVLLNISRSDSLTDGWVQAMTSVGAVKWALGAAALVLLVIAGVQALRRSRKEPSTHV